jgi:glycosyltransferase involved in cell wall biosynthesis
LREIGRGVRWLDREEMARELSGAAVVLCPSREEGFGLVALEAMAAGRPVVVSDIPAHREVCGDAVFYAAPGDERAWAAATGLALQVAHRPREAARQRAARFTWRAAAQQLDRVITRRASS